MRFWICPWVYLAAWLLLGCAQPDARLYLGSDHFASMQEEVRGVRFARASIYLDRDCGGRADGQPDRETAEPRILGELRLGLLDARYDGPDLKWFGPAAAYAFRGDGHFLAIIVRLASPGISGEEYLLINVHGSRFTFDQYGFEGDSFQSPRLARLIRSRLLPPKVPADVVATLVYLEQGVFHRGEVKLGSP